MVKIGLLDKNTDVVSRLESVIPYHGKSDVAFLCHEAAEHIKIIRDMSKDDFNDGLEAAATYMEACLGKGNPFSDNIRNMKP